MRKKKKKKIIPQTIVSEEERIEILEKLDNQKIKHQKKENLLPIYGEEPLMSSLILMNLIKSKRRKK